MLSTKCNNQHQGGVALLSRRCLHWHLEGLERFGPNVLKTTLAYDNKRTTIIGVYIPPSELDLQTNQYIDEAMLNEDPLSCIILGDLNVNYKNPKDERTEKIVDSIKTYDLIDLSTKFISKKSKPYTWSWRKFREGDRIQAVCDYILHGRKIQWKNFKVVDLPDFDTDHRLLKGKMISTLNHKGYRRYLKARKSHNLDLFGERNESIPPTPSDILLKEIHETIRKPDPTEPIDNSWISKETFNLLRQKTKALKSNISDALLKLGKDVRRSLRRDRRNRLWKVSTTIENCLNAGDIIGAFDVLKNWYKKYTGKSLKPPTIDLENTRKKYEELFTKDHDLPEELPDFEYNGDPIDDSIPQEEEIRAALFKMKNRKAPGLSKISVEELKEWCRQALEEDASTESKVLWGKIVELVQRCIAKRDVPRAFVSRYIFQ